MKRQHPTEPNLFWCNIHKGYADKEDFGKSRIMIHGIHAQCRECRSKTGKDSHPGHLFDCVLCGGVFRIGSGLNNVKYCLLCRPLVRAQTMREWAKKNPAKILQTRHRAEREGHDELKDRYIRRLIVRRYLVSATPEMIELKREQIMLHRELKQLKGELQNGIA